MEKSIEKIDMFRGKHSFLSNFYEAPIVYKGIGYSCSESAFQAQKTTDAELQRKFSAATAAESKNMGRKVKIRPDWEEIKQEEMYQILLIKFNSYSCLKRQLLETEDAELIEGNFWKDTYWGVCNGVGQNNLGKILMRIRKELRDEEKN